MSRTKNQWIAETGGFRLGETQGMFEKRVERIQDIHTKISDGIATAKDLDELAVLKGFDQDEE